MKIQFKYFLIFLFLFPTKSLAQNYTINETINYINNLLVNEKSKISFSNNSLTLKSFNGNNNEYIITKIININDISDVTISSDSYISVHINCLNKSMCTTKIITSSTNSFPEKRDNWLYFSISTSNYDIAEKISNALRYIIDKSKKTSSKKDPFSSYGVVKNNDKTININDLKIGMTKNEVFKTLNTQPILESIQKGYNIYRVKKGTQYFLYFTNDRLTRVDKGVRGPDAIIKLE